MGNGAVRLFRVPEGVRFFVLRPLFPLTPKQIVRYCMKKFFGIFTAALAMFALVVCAGCAPKGQVTEGENTVVIEASAEDDGKTLLAVMEGLQEAGELTFTISDGMVTSINGTSQTTSSYWMLYTSDAENANEQWGTFEYEGETLGSAIYGAGELTVKEGCIYLWAFESFGL